MRLYCLALFKSYQASIGLHKMRISFKKELFISVNYSLTINARLNIFICLNIKKKNA